MIIHDRLTVFDLIHKERVRQDAKWGPKNRLIIGDDSERHLILSEEVGEVAKAILEGDDVEAELIQVAAVAVAWLEVIRKRSCGDTRDNERCAKCGGPYAAHFPEICVCCMPDATPCGCTLAQFSTAEVPQNTTNE